MIEKNKKHYGLLDPDAKIGIFFFFSSFRTALYVSRCSVLISTAFLALGITLGMSIFVVSIYRTCKYGSWRMYWTEVWHRWWGDGKSCSKVQHGGFERKCSETSRFTETRQSTISYLEVSSSHFVTHSLAHSAYEWLAVALSCDSLLFLHDLYPYCLSWSCDKGILWTRKSGTDLQATICLWPDFEERKATYIRFGRSFLFSAEFSSSIRNHISRSRSLCNRWVELKEL